MSLESAQQFVIAMREDETFRHQVRAAANHERSTAVIQKNGFAFELHHLVVAMAACMEELEQGCGAERQFGLATRNLAGYCHICPICSYAAKKSNSIFERLMRWHRKWCPAWAAHTKVYGAKSLL